MLNNIDFSQKVIISKESFDNQNPHEIIDSNIQYLTKLFQHNIPESSICEESLKSYYIDYYLSHIKYGGFSNFREYIEKYPKILYYIKEGLKSIGANNHLELLIHAIQIDYETLQSFALFKTLFFEFQEKENLSKLNSLWITNHPQLLIIEEKNLNLTLERHISSIQKDNREIKIIKELCNIANQEFIRVTGEVKSSDNKSHQWHFRTNKGEYYMVQKNNLAIMHHSITQEPIVRGKVSEIKPQKEYRSIFNKFLGQKSTP